MKNLLLPLLAISLFSTAHGAESENTLYVHVYQTHGQSEIIKSSGANVNNNAAGFAIQHSFESAGKGQFFVEGGIRKHSYANSDNKGSLGGYSAEIATGYKYNINKNLSLGATIGGSYGYEDTHYYNTGTNREVRVSTGGSNGMILGGGFVQAETDNGYGVRLTVAPCYKIDNTGKNQYETKFDYAMLASIVKKF